MIWHFFYMTKQQAVIKTTGRPGKGTCENTASFFLAPTLISIIIIILILQVLSEI